MCPVFFEDHFRSETLKGSRWGNFCIWSHLRDPILCAQPSPVLCPAPRLSTQNYSFTVVPCWERCDPLQPIIPHNISSSPAVCQALSWVLQEDESEAVSVFKVLRRPEGKVVKPPVLISVLPEVGSGGSGFRKLTSNWGCSRWSWEDS